MGEQRKPDVDDVRKSSGSLHSGKQVRDPSDIRVAVYSYTAADYEENHKELHNSVIKNHPHWKITEIYMKKGDSGILFFLKAETPLLTISCMADPQVENPIFLLHIRGYHVNSAPTV